MKKTMDYSVQTTCLVDGKQLVLLQTAICNVIGNNQQVVVVKALFDLRSQQTYISNRLVKILNLKALRDISMMVRTFCSEAKNLHVKEYEIKIQLLNGEVLPIKVIVVPKICEKMRDQIVQKAVKVHPFIKQRRLADDGKRHDVRIELLFGADVYCKLVSGEIRRDDLSRLIAINSKFGWLLNGPVPRDDVLWRILI